MEMSNKVPRVLAWAQVDVFAERPLEGNMLAIFPDARGLSDEDMQALARETNLSETTFILPADEATEREHGVRVRIFTTAEEFPFAGHPTLGTASWLWANHPLYQGTDEVRLRLNIGTVPVRFAPLGESEQPGTGRPHTFAGQGVYGEMQQRDPAFGGMPDVQELARACGLQAEDFEPALPPQVVSTGLPFCVAPVRSLDALRRMCPQPAASAMLQACGAKLLYAITAAEDGWRARMPFNGSDDPATGSAAGCAISYLVQRGVVSSDEEILIKQGEEVRRPSRLHVRASLKGGHVTEVFVGGRTISVASGVFTLL